MSEFTQTEFNNILKRMSKIYLKMIIPNIGLKSKYEKVLTLIYIEEKSYAEIAEELNITRESVGNLATKARKELKYLIDKEYIVPECVKGYIDIFNKI